jgi:UDP-N-acetylmuramoyl-tripeptide--D-alanyl-D-alanine ligase
MAGNGAGEGNVTALHQAGTLFTLSEIARGTGGVAVRRSHQPVRGVDIDSRVARGLCLFVPLAGERVDGHRFIPDALDRGASAVLVSLRYWREHKDMLCGHLARADAAGVVVDDTLTALQDLARYHLDRFPDLFRIGVTGSSGKTTTKELLGAVLARFAPVMVSEGNLNSEIGVPLSAFAVTAAHRLAVFEMGVNHPGEMDVLASIVRPNLALITNIGTAHIGLLGSREKIAAEKVKIASFLKKDEALFVFEDDPCLDVLERNTNGRVVRYGPRRTQGYTGSRDLGLDGTAIDWEGLQIRFPLVGTHNLKNALAAVSMAAFLGVPAPLVRSGLEAARPLFGRSQVVRGKRTVIEDCYNANPDSMEQALSFLKEVKWSGGKWAVLGGMRELGGASGDLHRALGRFAAGLGLDGVLFYGEEAGEAWNAYRETLPAAEAPLRGAWRTDFQELVLSAAAEIREGSLVLVKGSRALELERLVPHLLGTAEKGDGA